MKKDKYWTEFWKNHGKITKDSPEQVQVLRTFNKKPINDKLWNETLDYIDDKLTICKEDKVLDLCCGNGLISKHFANKGAEVVSVDVSEDLVNNLGNQIGVTAIVSDIRDVAFESQSFTKVLVYAGIQYLNYSETIQLLEKIYNWLQPGGKLLLGDVPDQHRLWNFYNTPERRKTYISNVKNNSPIVGTWFTREFFDAASEAIGFSMSMYLPQPENHIYANFRYDYLIIK